MREPLIIKGGKNVDLRSNLLENSIVMLDTEFNPHVASVIIQQLLYLDTEGGKDPIQLYINSPGGCVVSGLAIYDTIKTLKREVHTVGIGMAASMGAFMLTCGAKKGNRQITKNCQVMFHRISSGTSGNIQDQRIRLEHSEKLDSKLSKIIAKSLGMKVKDYEKKVERDLWLEAQEVLDFGAADKII